ncbi:homocysteine S-methyltransferase family protein [Lentilactobacillus kisonensis]|uniref:Homocysteine S-methyltransferase n=1 Tax=Lentilactobacillus kisonensis F0435 TaxID=797516 RepID=H1LKB7_9LACO|nr:homocysteine S-methyltransferase family protein [Lentilactobacillus kisonensis]EHO47591.1 homocysteine S-methyltransferase [Lentilactobacillus kisonensis F0435]
MVLNFNQLKSPLLFDGAMGTMLISAVPGIKQPVSLANLTHPELVQQIHQAYVAAGCDIVTTNTFQLHQSDFTPTQVAQVVATGIQLAKSAHPKWVAYDMGPVNDPREHLTTNQLYERFKQQALLAEKGQVDFILIETMTNLQEARMAVKAVHENTQLPVAVTFSFQPNGLLPTGEDGEAVTRYLQNLAVDALGLNCGFGPASMMQILGAVLMTSRVPVIVQPNTSVPYSDNGNFDQQTQPATFAAAMGKMLAQGVQLIGSCCGSTPTVTGEVRKLIDQFDLK